MGLQNNVVTLWAVTDEKEGIDLKFSVRFDGDSVTKLDCDNYVTSFINDFGIWHLFGEKPAMKPNDFIRIQK